MRASRFFVALVGVGLLFTGCGGDNSDQNSTSGGADPAQKIADENVKVQPPKNDPNYEKMATPEKKNRGRDVGASSGGGTSSAILD